MLTVLFFYFEYYFYLKSDRVGHFFLEYEITPILNVTNYYITLLPLTNDYSVHLSRNNRVLYEKYTEKLFSLFLNFCELNELYARN